MTVTKTIRIKIHRAQSLFRKSQALYRGYVGGRGAGKTWIGAYDLLRRAKRGHTYLVASPTYTKLEDETLPTFTAIAQEIGVYLDKYDAKEAGLEPSLIKTPRPNVRLTNGAVVRFRSAEDPEMLRGPNLSGVWLDEASLMVESAFSICIMCLREHGEQGWLSATFTPKGKTHWTYSVFASGKPNSEMIHSRTCDNPFLPKGFEGPIREMVSVVLAGQELDGLFLDTPGTEWPASYFPDSCWFDQWPRESIVLSVIHLDPSKGQGPDGARRITEKTADDTDYSAFVFICMDNRGHIWIDADMDNRRDTARIVEDGLGLLESWPRQTGAQLDAFGVEEDAWQFLIAEKFAEKATARALIGIPWVKTRTGGIPKVVRIRSQITRYLNRGVLHFRRTPGARLLVRQMQQFPLQGHGIHDDGPDSLAAALKLGAEIWNGTGEFSGKRNRK